MATAPQSRKLNLTRDQLAEFLTDQQQIRQFELLFSAVDQLQVIVGTDFEYQADTAAATANEALAQISRLAQDAAVSAAVIDGKTTLALDQIATLAQDTSVEDAVLNAKVQQALDAIPRLAQVLNLLALAPVQQNNNSVTTDYIDFNSNAPNPATKIGRLHWDGRVFYATPNANNLGVTVNEHFVARTGTKTMTSNTSLQAVFSGGSGGLTNGALTVNGSTSYYFECSLNLSSMSASSGNLGFSIVGAGTATFTSAAWHAFGLDATTQTTGAAIGGSFSAAAGATGNISTAATGTSYSVVIKGIFRINAAGTIIPSVQLTTASAAVVGANCWFKCNAIGTNTVVSVGNWS
jgi:hypothetical protein